MPKRKGHPTGRAKKAPIASETIFFYLPDEIPYAFSSNHRPHVRVQRIYSRNISSRWSLIVQSSSICSANALYFSDEETCKRILATPDPKEQKKLGLRVDNFNDAKWSRKKFRVAIMGSWYKYCQNKNMREVLLSTGERRLCEASRRDRVWGIGFNAQEAEEYREEWGESLLGKALMRFRARLKEWIRLEREGKMVDWMRDGGDDEEEEGQVDADQKSQVGVPLSDV